MKMLMLRNCRNAALVALALALAACASSHAKKESLIVKTDAQYYQDANSALKIGNYSAAVASFEELESQYPVGRYTEQAQLEVIYGKYMQADYIAAIASADRYLRLHPESPRLDYVLYYRGLSNYAADQDVLLKHLPVNMAYRDPGQAKIAYDDFRQLLTRYPNSPYVADARQRMIYMRNQAAEAELNVARYYETRGASISALNRARWVVENYPESTSIGEALQIEIRSYRKLGMNDLADQTAALLQANKTEVAIPAPKAPAKTK